MEMDVFLSACIVIGLLSSRLVGLVIEQRRRETANPWHNNVREPSAVVHYRHSYTLFAAFELCIRLEDRIPET